MFQGQQLHVIPKRKRNSGAEWLVVQALTLKESKH
jgi:hypothetical protein